MIISYKWLVWWWLEMITHYGQNNNYNTWIRHLQHAKIFKLFNCSFELLFLDYINLCTCNLFKNKAYLKPTWHYSPWRKEHLVIVIKTFCFLWLLFPDPVWKFPVRVILRLYLYFENSFPNMIWSGIRKIKTAMPARHDAPISCQSRPITAAACRGPSHR